MCESGVARDAGRHRGLPLRSITQVGRVFLVPTLRVGTHTTLHGNPLGSDRVPARIRRGNPSWLPGRRGLVRFATIA